MKDKKRIKIILCGILFLILSMLIIVKSNALTITDVKVKPNTSINKETEINTTVNLNNTNIVRKKSESEKNRNTDTKISAEIDYTEYIYDSDYSDDSIEIPVFHRIMRVVMTIFPKIAILVALFLGIIGFLKIIKKKQKRGIIYIVLAFILGGIGYALSLVRSLKPIIYIYPEKEIEVKIRLGKKEKLTCTYPKYQEEWFVKAKPNGDLEDLKTGRKLYALYWEGLNTNKQKIEEGFIVEGEHVASFLEEKLEILGLNEREAEEFIVYWLPQMEHNKYNYIRFETIDEINENMPLEIVPKPETLIRINMVFKPLRSMIDIKKQELKKIQRKGYTVVEWGGSKI